MGGGLPPIAVVQLQMHQLTLPHRGIGIYTTACYYAVAVAVDLAFDLDLGHTEPKRGAECWGVYGTTTWVTKKCIHIGDTLIET